MIDLIEKICDMKKDNIIDIKLADDNVVIDPDYETKIVIHDSFVEIIRHKEDMEMTSLIPYSKIEYVKIINQEELEKFREKKLDETRELMKTLMGKDKED